MHFYTARLLRIAVYASVTTASLLILAKTVAWLLTGSISVMASLVDSLMDVGALLVNLFAVRYSLTPTVSCSKASRCENAGDY